MTEPQPEKKSVWKSVVIAVVTIIFTGVVFNDKQFALIAGCMVLMLAALYEIRNSINSKQTEVSGRITTSHNGILDSIKKSQKQLLKIIKIDNAYFNDDWLHEALDRIVEFREKSKIKGIHVQTITEQIFNENLEQIKNEIGDQWHKITKKEDEMKRMTFLKDTVSKAKGYVFAATYDVDNYIELFWGAKVFSDPYVDINIEAAKNVDVQRIFVIEETMRSSEKYNMFKNLIQSLNNQQNLTIYVTTFSQLSAGSIDKSNTSFMICDDCITSESSGMSNGKTIDGYYAGNQNIKKHENISTIKELKERFEEIRLLSKKIPNISDLSCVFKEP
ncbi:MAG: hypothetical protein GY797_15210 [Deltaproteobacteria bacterium]|nr:hypothetical protein [Deltaproteobacteria bacterium]